MNLAKEEKSLNAALDSYSSWLTKIPEEQFGQTPPRGGWSFAEVYTHILTANLGCINAVHQCAQKKTKPTTKGLTFLGKLMFFFGAYPPFPVKQPGIVAKNYPVKKISKEEARNMLAKLRLHLAPLKSEVYHSLPQYKQEHPVLGMLNAAGWYKFIRIHSERHLEQLARIEKSLK